jgi:hypothetical protein
MLMVTYRGCQKRGGQRRFGNGPHMEEGEEDDHEGPGPITSRRPLQPGTLMSKISRTVRGGKEVARNVHKGCRTLDMMMMIMTMLMNALSVLSSTCEPKERGSITEGCRKLHNEELHNFNCNLILLG